MKMKNFNLECFGSSDFDQLIADVQKQAPGAFVYGFESLSKVFVEYNERNVSEYVVDFTGTNEYILKRSRATENGKLVST